MQQVVLATSNPNKVVEINAIMKGFDIEFILPPSGFNPVETGKTFEENALIKANEACNLTNFPVLADDSGLCIDVLNGAPGIFSARYAGTQEEKINKILTELKNVPFNKRNAHFTCAIVLLSKNGQILFSDNGNCQGKIGFEPHGANGFGYDPIFVVDGIGKSMSELTDFEKNQVSHRAIALAKLKAYLTLNSPFGK